MPTRPEPQTLSVIVAGPPEGSLLAQVRAIHWAKHYDTDPVGQYVDWWLCQECRGIVESPCDTLRVGTIDGVRALHYETNVSRKVRDGWFKSHRVLVGVCHECRNDWPCRTTLLLGPVARGA